MWTPLFSVDPMDPRAGRKVPLRIFVIGIIAIVAFITISGLLISWTKEKPEVTSEDITAYFEAEGFQIYDMQYDIARPNRQSVYGGRLWANSESEWYIGKKDLKSDISMHDWKNAILVYSYDNSRDAADAVSGLSSDGSYLITEDLSGSIQYSIDREVDRRVYLYENTVVYYEGGDEDIYAALEKLCGEPIADGRNVE